MQNFIPLPLCYLETFGENGSAFSRFLRPLEVRAGIFRGRAPGIEGDNHILARRVKYIGKRDGIDIRRNLRDVTHQHIPHLFIQICIGRIVDICADTPNFSLADSQAIF